MEEAIRAYRLGLRLNPTDGDNLYNMVLSPLRVQNMFYVVPSHSVCLAPRTWCALCAPSCTARKIWRQTQDGIKDGAKHKMAWNRMHVQVT